MKKYLAQLQDPDPDVRSEAAEALGQMGVAAATPEVIEALVDRLLRDEAWVVRMNAAQALGRMGAAAATPEVVGALAQRLREDEGEWVRQEAAWALGEMGEAAATPEVLEALVQALRDRNSDVRSAAAWALREMGSAAARPEVIEALIQALRDRDPDVRSAAAKALGRMGEATATQEVIQALIQRLLQDESGWVRREAAGALGRLLPAHPEALRDFLRALPAPMTPQETQTLEEVFLDSPGAVPALRALLSDPDPKIRAKAVWALGAVGPAAATPEVVRDLLARRLDRAPNVRTAALEVLRKLPVSSETVSAVLRDIQGDEPEAAEAAAWALERLG